MDDDATAEVERSSLEAEKVTEEKYRCSEVRQTKLRKTDAAEKDRHSRIKKDTAEKYRCSGERQTQRRKTDAAEKDTQQRKTDAPGKTGTA